MAAPLRHVILSSRHFIRPIIRDIRVVANNAYFHTTGYRQLLSLDSLGIEDFKRVRYDIKESLGDQKDRFRAMMEDYMNSSDKGTIFTTDLKTMVHICETVDELQSLENMIKTYHKQSNTLRFTTFTFGPIVMRLLSILKKPTLAYSLFKDKELDGFFDQMSSFTILMDNLLEGEMYNEVLEVYDIVCKKMLDGVRYPHDAVILASAACLKLNTTESFQKFLQLLSSVKPENMNQRSLVYGVVLALEQNEYKMAEELLAHCKNKKGSGFIIENMETLVQVRLGKLEAALNIWKDLLNSDEPDPVAQTQPRNKYLFTHIAGELEAAVEQGDDVTLKNDLQHVMKGLQEQGILQDVQLMEFIFRPLVRKRQLQDGYKQRRRSAVQPGQRVQSRGKTAFHKRGKVQWPEDAS